MHESGETYLETLLLLNKRLSIVRSIDVATDLGYSKASVSRAMGILKRLGYIDFQKGGAIQLTAKGFEKASSIYERHCYLTAFFQNTLNLPKEDATQNACRFEHVISPSCFVAIKNYVLENQKNKL